MTFLPLQNIKIKTYSVYYTVYKFKAKKCFGFFSEMTLGDFPEIEENQKYEYRGGPDLPDLRR